MKNSGYFNLMYGLCIAGLIACIGSLVLFPDVYILFKLIIIIIGALYAAGIVRYKKINLNNVRTKHTDNTVISKKKYPENSFYSGIRRSV